MNPFSIFKRKPAGTVDPHKDQLVTDMSYAMAGYLHAIDEYETYLSSSRDDAGSQMSQSKMMNVSVYREQYLNARLTYEAHYGDVGAYLGNIERFNEIREEINITCMHLPLEISPSLKQSLDSMSSLD